MEDDDDIPKIGLAAKKAQEEEIPKIGRGRSRTKIPIRQLFVIGMTLMTLIVILVMRKSCAQGVGKAFNNLAPPPPDAGVQYIPLPGPPATQAPAPATQAPAPATQAPAPASPAAQPTTPAAPNGEQMPPPRPTHQDRPLRPVPATPGR